MEERLVLFQQTQNVANHAFKTQLADKEEKNRQLIEAKRNLETVIDEERRQNKQRAKECEQFGIMTQAGAPAPALQRPAELRSAPQRPTARATRRRASCAEPLLPCSAARRRAEQRRVQPAACSTTPNTHGPPLPSHLPPAPHRACISS